MDSVSNNLITSHENSEPLTTPLTPKYTSSPNVPCSKITSIARFILGTALALLNFVPVVFSAVVILPAECLFKKVKGAALETTLSWWVRIPDVTRRCFPAIDRTPEPSPEPSDSYKIPQGIIARTYYKKGD